MFFRRGKPSKMDGSPAGIGLSDRKTKLSVYFATVLAQGRGTGRSPAVVCPQTNNPFLWYERRLKEGVQVFIADPRLVETGLDLLFAPTIIFHESGYSLHTLRQASRRSWRIGQKQPVRVKFLCYESTMQARCLRLMGKKLLRGPGDGGQVRRRGASNPGRRR